MSKIILDEQAAFALLTEGLKTAADGARMLAVHQSDKAHMWNKMSEVYLVAVQAAHKLAEEKALKQAGLLRQ